MTEGPEVPAISVVVPAYRAATFLPRTLPPLLQAKQRGDVREVIVVDDASPDDGAQVAEALGATILRHTQNRGAAAARNTGAHAALGPILLFLDADVLVDPSMPREVLRWFVERGGVAAVTGRYDPDPANNTAFARYKALWTFWCWEGAAVQGRASHLQGALFAIDRTTFVRCGGFDERYEGGNVEDYELSARLRQAGIPIHFDDRLRGKHHFPGPGTVAQNYWDRARMWVRLRPELGGFSSGQASKRNGASAAVAMAGAALHTGGMLAPPLHLAALGFDAGWVLLQAPFLGYAASKLGKREAIRMAAWHWTLHAVAGAAAVSAPFGRGSRRGHEGGPWPQPRVV